MCWLLSLLGTVPPTKIAQLTWPQALHYHHREEKEGEGALQTKPRFSHSTLERKTQFFTRQRGWGGSRERNWWGANDGLAVIFLPSLLPFHLPELYFGGLSQVQWAARRWMRGVRCLQCRVESAPPTIEAVVEGASPAHFGSLFVSTHVAYYVNYFAGQKTTTGQDREGEREGRCLRPRHIGLSSAQRGLVMLKWAHKAILTVLCF